MAEKQLDSDPDDLGAARERLRDDFEQAIWALATGFCHFIPTHLPERLAKCDWQLADLLKPPLLDETLALLIKRRVFPEGSPEEKLVFVELFIRRYVDTKRASGFLRHVMGCNEPTIAMDAIYTVVLNQLRPELSGSRLASYDPDRPFESYFFAAIRRAYLDILKKGGPITGSSGDDDYLDSLPNARGHIDWTTFASEFEDAPPEYSHVFFGMRRDRKKASDIAVELRIRIKAVFDIYESAKQLLRCRLENADRHLGDSHVKAPPEIGSKDTQLVANITITEADGREYRLGLVPLNQRLGIRDMSACLPQGVSRHEFHVRKPRNGFLVVLLSFPAGSLAEAIKVGELSWPRLNELGGHAVDSWIVRHTKSSQRN